MANFDTITNMLRKMQEANQASGQMMLEKAKAEGQGVQGLVQGMRDVAGVIANRKAQERKEAAEMARQQAGIQAQKDIAKEERQLQKDIAAEREKTIRGAIGYSQFAPSGSSDRDKRFSLSPTANQILKEIGGDKYLTYDPATGQEKLNYEELIKNKDVILQRAKLQLDNMVNGGLDPAQAQNTLRELELALQGATVAGNNQGTVPAGGTGATGNVTGDQIERYAKSFLTPYNRAYRNMTDQINAGNMEAANDSAASIRSSITNSTLSPPVKQGLLDRLAKTLADLRNQRLGK